VFKEDWGEQLVGVHVTVLVVLDTEKDEVKVLDGIPDNISPGQVMRITNTESAVDNYTRKISRLIASLPTSRQQVVFALLVPSCQQVWNNLLNS
jgi:acylaminoacyl-peptidase